MKYIHIKNLEKYHPSYKDRELKWCKAYFKMINADPEFEMLEEVDKWRFIALIMLELQAGKPIPLDDLYLIRKGFDLKKHPIDSTINMLHNFIDIVTDDTPIPLRKCDVDKIREDNIQTSVTDTGFDQFWRVYPKKVGKAKALLIWKKLLRDSSVNVQLVLGALEKQKASRDWLKEGGQYIPHPSTYLNQKRWEDEMTDRKDWRDG